MAFDSPIDRRTVLADWLADPANPYFSRAITNRVWANFMGVGLVEAVDDMRLTNPPSNAELLTALAKYLVDNHYDLKSLMRVILQSETYQRSSQTLPKISPTGGSIRTSSRGGCWRKCCWTRFRKSPARRRNSRTMPTAGGPSNCPTRMSIPIS